MYKGTTPLLELYNQIVQLMTTGSCVLVLLALVGRLLRQLVKNSRIHGSVVKGGDLTTILVSLVGVSTLLNILKARR